MRSTFRINLNVRAWCLALTGLLAATAGVAGAERPMRFEQLAEEAGLSQSSVFAMLQDSQGFMWFGTEDGLNRFDGYRFKVYKHDVEDPASIPADFVFALAEDAAGDLWIGTDGAGVARLDVETGRFEQLAGSSRYVRALDFDADGKLWVGTRDAGVERIDPATGASVRFVNHADDASSLCDDRIFALFSDRSGSMWVGTDAGLCRFDSSESSFERFVHRPNDPGSLSDGRIRSIFEDRHGALWVGTYGGGLNRLDRETGEFLRFRHDPENPTSLSHDRVRAIFEDADGRLWIGTSSGLNLMQADGRGFARYQPDAADPTSLGDDHVLTLMQDRGGVLWVGTRSAGVHKWNPLTWQFGHQPADPADPHGLQNPRVTSFTEDAEGNLWLGTFGGGVHVMNRASGKMNHYRHAADDSRSLSSDRVMSLLNDARGNLWVGTLDGGLNRFEPRTGTFRTLRHDPDGPSSLGADGVMALFEDSRGTLWVGTFGGGLNRFNPSAGSFTRFAHDPQDPRSLSGNRVTSVTEDAHGDLWVGTDSGGLNRFDPRTGKAEHFRHRNGDAASLASDVVYAVFVDAADELWVGTRDGLSHLLDDGRFESFTDKHGLPNDVIYAIRADDSGCLWLSTNRGLSRFDPRTETFRNYNATHGLQANEFNFGAAYRSTSGEMFFGGVNGFNAFVPEALRLNEHVPPVVLTSLLKFNRPAQDLEPADRLREIELGFRDDVVTFEFAALDFAAPEHNRYMYKLEGFDDEWIDLGQLHRVTYTDLDGGHYTFRVRAANNDGVWNEQGLAIALDVAPPPWKSRWAYGTYVMLFVGCAFGFVRTQRRKLEREEEYALRLEDDVRERTDELVRRTSQLETLNHQLAQASVTDSLTGLANRRFLMQYLDREVALVHRHYAQFDQGTITRKSLDLAFLMIDLDNFKTINDTSGHAAGDRVLTQLKQILQETCRTSDILIRWGGDEFMIVCRESDAQGLAILAERIRSRIAEHVFEVGDGQIVRTTCSIGYACYPFLRTQLDALTWEQVVGVADRALYVAKASGRNAWVGFNSTETTPVEGLLAALRNEPGRLVGRGQLDVATSLDGDVEWH